MNRRSAIRNFVIVSAGASLLPSCLQKDDSKATILLHDIRVSGSQEKMLAALTESILPTTVTPGAKALSSHAYVLMMVDDCFKKEEQEKFMRGLAAFDETAEKIAGNDFVNAEDSQRRNVLKAVESKKDVPEDVLSFYNSVKRLTIQSFTGSRYYLTEVRKYEMVPGRFHGSFPVADKKM